MFVSPLVLASAIAAFQPSPSSASPVSAADPQSIVRLLQDEGYKAQLDKDSTGDPMIISAANGFQFGIYFYGCEDHRNCKSIQFQAGYTTDKDKKLSAEKMSEFNQSWRFAKASLDADRDPAISFDVVFGGSPMAAPMFAEALASWTESMGHFQKHIGW